MDAPTQTAEDGETTLAATLGEHDNDYEYVETDMLIEESLASPTGREQHRRGQ